MGFLFSNIIEDKVVKTLKMCLRKLQYFFFRLVFLQLKFKTFVNFSIWFDIFYDCSFKTTTLVNKFRTFAHLSLYCDCHDKEHFLHSLLFSDIEQRR